MALAFSCCCNFYMHKLLILTCTYTNWHLLVCTSKGVSCTYISQHLPVRTSQAASCTLTFTCKYITIHFLYLHKLTLTHTYKHTQAAYITYTSCLYYLHKLILTCICYRLLVYNDVFLGVVSLLFPTIYIIQSLLPLIQLHLLLLQP